MKCRKGERKLTIESKIKLCSHSLKITLFNILSDRVEIIWNGERNRDGRDNDSSTPLGGNNSFAASRLKYAERDCLRTLKKFSRNIRFERMEIFRN